MNSMGFAQHADLTIAFRSLKKTQNIVADIYTQTMLDYYTLQRKNHTWDRRHLHPTNKGTAQLNWMTTAKESHFPWRQIPQDKCVALDACIKLRNLCTVLEKQHWPDLVKSKVVGSWIPHSNGECLWEAISLTFFLHWLNAASTHKEQQQPWWLFLVTDLVT